LSWKTISLSLSVCFSPCNRFFASGSIDGTARIYGIDPFNPYFNGNLYYVFNLRYSVSSVCFSKARYYFAVSCLHSNLVQIFYFNYLDKKNIGKKLLEINNDGNKTFSVQFSSDANFLILGNDIGLLSVYGTDPDNITTYGKLVSKKSSHKNAVVSVSFSNSISNLRYIATGGQDEIANLIKFNTTNNSLEILFKFEEQNGGPVWSVSFSPNDEFIATGSYDNTVCIYGVNESDSENFGKLITRLGGHTWSVTSVCFSPNGKYLASGSEDVSINLHKINLNSKTPFKSKKHMSKLTRSHNKVITSIAFSTNGYLGSGSKDYTSVIYY